MREGVVIKVENQTAWVRFTQHSACKKCGACQLGGSDAKQQVVTALNQAQAVTNDLVQIDMPQGNITAVSLYAYGIPLLALVLGIILGALLGLSEVTIALLGLSSLFGAYLISNHIINPYLKNSKRYNLVVTKII